MYSESICLTGRTGASWRRLVTVGIIGVIPAVLFMLQLAPLLGAVVMMSCFAIVAGISVEAGIATLIVLTGVDIYVQSATTAFFASQLLVLVLFIGGVWRLVRQLSRMGLLDWLVLLFWVSVSASIPLAASKAEALKAFVKISSFVMAFFVIRSVELSVSLMGLLLKTLTFICVFTSSYGLFQYATGGGVQSFENCINLHVTQAVLDQTVTRWYSTFRYSLEFATFAALTGSIIVARLIVEKKRAIWVAALAGVVGGVLVSYSRAALLALIFSVLVQLKISRTSLRTYVVVGALVGVVAIAAVCFVDTAIDRFASISDIDSVSYAGRLAKWGVGVELIRDHPFTGVGIGNVSIVMPLSYETGSATDIPNLENLFLTYAAQIGLPGACLLLTILIIGIIKARRAYWRSASPTQRSLALGIVGSLVVVLVNGLTDPVLVGGQNSVLVFLMLGLIAGLAGQESQCSG